MYPKEYFIKAWSYGAVDNILQQNGIYFLQGKFIPPNNVKNPDTFKHEFVYDSACRLMVGDSDLFQSDLHNTVAVDSFGIIISKTSIIEMLCQTQNVKEGRAEPKPTTVIIVKHNDYNPVVFFLSIICSIDLRN